MVRTTPKGLEYDTQLLLIPDSSALAVHSLYIRSWHFERKDDVTVYEYQRIYCIVLEEYTHLMGSVIRHLYPMFDSVSDALFD